MIRRVRVFAGLVLVTLAASPLEAQAPADSPTQLLQEARTHRWIMRVTADSVMDQGVVTQLTDSTFTIANRQVPLAALDMLERRMSSRRSLRTGAIVGGLIGAGMGGLGAAFACSMSESADDCTPETFLIVGLTAGIGAGFGALSAGFLGSSEWRVVWRR